MVRRFARLWEVLAESTSDATATPAREQALVGYFSNAAPEDGVWALALLMGQRPKRLVPVESLRELCLRVTGTPEWLFEESLAEVGDLAETLSLLIPRALTTVSPVPLHRWLEERLPRIEASTIEERLRMIEPWWRELSPREIFLLNKILTGELRAVASAAEITRALATVAGTSVPLMAHRLKEDWPRSVAAYRELLSPAEQHPQAARRKALPYPFSLASPLDRDRLELGAIEAWCLEWKWDGLRVQAVRRGEASALWSVDDAILTDRFPELAELVALFPEGTVIDADIVAFRDGLAQPVSALDKRLGRGRLTAKLLAESPVRLVAFDLLEENGRDLRRLCLRDRRDRLARLVDNLGSESLLLSPVVAARSWDEASAKWQSARQHRTEGLMLRRYDSGYGEAQGHRDWWLWQSAAQSVDAVLVYAQPGSEYTFAVWRDSELVPIARASSGLEEHELEKLDDWIRTNTVEKFGPVRSVRPELVFELAFEGVSLSSRHKAGLTVRSPRIVRWRADKRATDADSVERVRALLD